MKNVLRNTVLLLVLTLLASSLSFADDQSGRVGIGVYSGPHWLWQGTGNILITEPAPQNALSSAGYIFGGMLRVVIAPEFAIMFSGQYGFSNYEGINLDYIC